MTRREELLALADRVVAAIAEQQSYMLELAYQEIHGIYPGAHISLPSHALRFGRMVRAEAYESAAMSLVPEGWGFVLASKGIDDDNPDKWCVNIAQDPDDAGRLTFAATPALALTAAALRAHAEQQP